MKRYQWMGIMLSLVLLLCSCGTDKEVEKKAGESTSTPSATASVTPLISEDEAFSEAEKIVKTMTIEQKVGQMFLVDLLQLDASPSVDGTAYKATDSMKQAIIDYHLGGVYLTKENIKSQKQTKKLPPVIQYPDECWNCNACVFDCPVKALSLRIPAPASIVFVDAPKKES